MFQTLDSCFVFAVINRKPRHDPARNYLRNGFLISCYDSGLALQSHYESVTEMCKCFLGQEMVRAASGVLTGLAEELLLHVGREVLARFNGHVDPLSRLPTHNMLRQLPGRFIHFY